jgi:glycolate oxidase FAD binding subunit
MSHPLLDNWKEISEHSPPKLFRPESALDLQRFLRAEKNPCLIAGNGTKWWLGNRPQPAATCIDLRNFNHILEYSPGDLTITAQAGLGFSVLNAALAQQRQTLPVDPPLAAQATLGGMISVGISGPLQQVYGTLRDKVLGVRVMHPDGTITRAGGKVVKNVAGYDLCKLYTGSMGTLAVILEATVRVFPCPDTTYSFSMQLENFDQAQERFLFLREMPVQPAGVVYVAESEQPPQMIIRICGPARSVGEQLSHLASAFHGLASEDDLVATVFDAFYQDPSPVWLRSDSLLSSLSNVAQVVRREVAINRMLVDLSSRRCHYAAQSAPIEKLQRIRNNLEGLNAALVVEKAPLALKQQIDVWGSAREDLPLARKIKQALDPEARFNPGRYV